MANGHQFTAPAGRMLTEQLANTSYKVVYDHDIDGLSQVIVGWYGKDYTPPYRMKQLSHLDIAVVDRETTKTREPAKIYLLVEIEDTTRNPKKLLGNATATLLCDGIAIGKKSDWKIGEWSTLLLFARCKDKAQQEQIAQRLLYFEEQMRKVDDARLTSRAPFGRLIIESFIDQQELDGKISKYISKFLRHS